MHSCSSFDKIKEKIYNQSSLNIKNQQLNIKNVLILLQKIINLLIKIISEQRGVTKTF